MEQTNHRRRTKTHAKLNRAIRRIIMCCLNTLRSVQFSECILDDDTRLTCVGHIKSIIWLACECGDVDSSGKSDTEANADEEDETGTGLGE